MAMGKGRVSWNVGGPRTRHHVQLPQAASMFWWGMRRAHARWRVIRPQTSLRQLAGNICIDMDFLKSAVASAISKGPAFGYTFGDRVDLNDSIWTLHNGTKRVWPGCLRISELLPLTLLARKMAQSAAYLPSTLPRTSHACLSPAMRSASYERCDTPVL